MNATTIRARDELTDAILQHGFREVTPQQFIWALEPARRTTRVDPQGRQRTYGETVHQYSLEEYGWMRLFLSARHGAGFALKNDPPDIDLVSVFSIVPGWGHKAVTAATLLGATVCDVFDEDGYLPDFYAAHGFKEVGRDAWDPQYAPEVWNGGTPDVVYLERHRD